MAVLALAFVGEAIGASIGGTVLGIAASSLGGFIGSAIGGMVDNMLFPTKQQGPRLGDLSVQSSTYGQAIPKLYGPQNRIAGNVIYSSDLIETSHKQHSGKGGPSVDQTTYSYSVNIAVALADCAGPKPGRERPINAVRKIWANAKLIWDDGVVSGVSEVGPQSAALWSSLTFHDGAMDQMPDANLEAVFGVGNIQAFRGTAYAVIWGFQLADYGNRTPNLEFLVEQDERISVSDVLVDIAAACGIDPNTISSSTVMGDVQGYAIGTQASGTAALQPMALVWNFDSAEVGGGLRFTARGSGFAGIVDHKLLSGHEITDQRPEEISWTRAPETGLPREASLTFADPNRDWQVNTQVARRSAGSADSNLTSQVPIVIDVPTGRQVTDRLMWEAWNGRDTATAVSDDRLIDLEAGRVYLFKTPAGIEPLRLTGKTRGANGVIQLQLARDRSEVYQSTAQGVSADVPIQVVNVPGPTSLMLLDAPIFQDADDDSGFYYLVDGKGKGWRGADVKRSTDGGATFDEVAPTGFQTVMGDIDGLGDGPSVVFDTVNVMRVHLDDPSDQLSSVGMEAVLNGTNACWVGNEDGHDGEVLQFMNATLISPGVYDLSGFLRGRLGTEYATGTHGSGQRFVLLQQDDISRVDYTPSDWNKEREYKAVSLLLTDADAVAQPFTGTGEGKRPLSPVQVQGIRDPGTGDASITWVRRSRLRQPGLGNGSLPLGESTERYEIDISAMVTGGGAVLRTLTSTTPEVAYTDAQIIADGFSPGDVAVLAVYQISDVRGRGRPGNAELQL